MIKKINYIYKGRKKEYFKEYVLKHKKECICGKLIYPNSYLCRSCSQKGKRHSEETKNKIRNKLIGGVSPMRGKHHTEETKQKIINSNYHKNLKDKNNPFYGKRHSLKTKEKMSLSHNGTGIPYEKTGYSENFYKIRNLIRKKDSYICQLCKTKQKDKNLDVHHIDYDKKNNNVENLISLCKSCHLRTNFNRNIWKKILKNCL